jgi:hypothetical protein
MRSGQEAQKVAPLLKRLALLVINLLINGVDRPCGWAAQLPGWMRDEEASTRLFRHVDQALANATAAVVSLEVV